MSGFDLIRAVLFVAVSLALAVVSLRSLRNPRAHGFARFIAWEAIAALAVWNLPHWFADPLSLRQILSWSLLFASLWVLWAGVSRLSTGRASGRRANIGGELYAFERTTNLVTTGIYSQIRHPMYASLLYLAWGAFLKDIGWISAALTAVASVSLFATAKADERECIGVFGAHYKAYMKRTKMFIPFVF